MPTRYGLPTLYEAVPYPGAPVCFHRVWCEPLVPVLHIFGYSCRSTFAEDHDGEDSVWVSRGGFPSVCFSERERDGEYGFTPVLAVTEIAFATLERELRRLGVEWVHDE